MPVLQPPVVKQDAHMRYRYPGIRRYLNILPLTSSGPTELAARLRTMPIGESASFGWDDRHARHVATITRLNETEYHYAHDGIGHCEMTDTAERAALALLVQADR